ncbi:class F sortase [Candidatus Saccharibacteria bacterium]|nr:class F sortase [Candidatus Saccharibacteria bacterium]
MFEENLQLGAPGFGFNARRPVKPKPVISDIGTSGLRYSAPQAEPARLEVEQVQPAQAVLDVPDLPDFLLHPQSVKASTLSSPRFSNSKKIILSALVATFIILGVLIFLGLFRPSRLTQAAKFVPVINLGGSSPLTNKPSALAVSSYQVSADKPRYLDISFLKIHSRMQGTTITENDTPSSPINRYDTAWDNSSSKPGEQGAMVVGSSATGCINPGVFYNLKKIELGSDIVIIRGDGTSYSYKVTKAQTYDKNQVNRDLLLAPAVSGRPGLNIVTCAGQQNEQTGDFNKRLVVNAVLY